MHNKTHWHIVSRLWLLVALMLLGCQIQSLAQSPQSATNPNTDAFMNQIEQQSKQIKTLKAKLRYDRIQSLLGDEQRRFGRLIYDAGPPARFAIHFDKRVTDGDRLDRQNRWHIFDGRWLVRRFDDEKQFWKDEIVPPAIRPEEADPLALGEGPFLVPFNFNKQRVLKKFDVVMIDPAEDDPPHTRHLRLTVKPGRLRKFTEIDIWYGCQSLLPVLARTKDEAEDESVIHLTDVAINEVIDPKVFDTSPPAQNEGWHVEINLWQEGR